MYSTFRYKKLSLKITQNKSYHLQYHCLHGPLVENSWCTVYQLHWQINFKLQRYMVFSMVQICGFIKGIPIHWIEDQKVPYATKNSEWVGFDNKESYETKVGGTSALYFNTFTAYPKYLHQFLLCIFFPNRCATCRSRSLVVPLCGPSIWMTLLDGSVERAVTLCWLIYAHFSILVSPRHFYADVFL